MTANLDTYVSSPYPTATYASATELRVGTYNGGGDKYRSYLQFPLSGSAGRTSSRGQHQGRQTRRQRGGLGRGRGGRSAVHLEGRHHLTPLRRVGRHQSGLQLLRPHDTAGQVLSSLYVNGTSTYDGTADTLVCGFHYERVAGPSLADLGRTYVTSPAGPSLADLARRSFPEQASPQDILDAEAEQGWDSPAPTAPGPSRRTSGDRRLTTPRRQHPGPDGVDGTTVHPAAETARGWTCAVTAQRGGRGARVRVAACMGSVMVDGRPSRGRR